MSLTDWINLVASVLGILAVAIPVYLWATKKIRIVSVQDPKQPVTKERLSFEDTKLGIEILSQDALRFAPNYLFGINRGGAIVGGMIAKRIKKPFVYLLEVNYDKNGDDQVCEHNLGANLSSQDRIKILLIDDAYRAGDHMQRANDYLRKKYPNAELRRVVMLEIKSLHVGPEQETRNLIPIECSAFFTHDGRVRNAWDG